MDNVLIEPTLDGSNTLYVPSLDEYYHSVNGAKQESLHVYINAGLAECKNDSVKVLEIGFGTGLNTYLSLLYAGHSNKNIDYTALELYPLNSEVISKLNYTEKDTFSDQALFEKLHNVLWNKKEGITDFFSLTKLQCDLTKLDFNFDHKFDIIYFDAFAPEKQPEMWTPKIFDFLYSYTSQDGILTTYCAKGLVRRMLQSSGYKVERLAGPPGKREMLRAQK